MEQLNCNDLIINTAPRLPVCLCLDVSGSMNLNGAIDSLNKGVSDFYEAIENDKQARASCEIAIVCFNDKIQVVEDFSCVSDKRITSSSLRANGGTRLAGGVSKALEILEERKNKYKANGVDYYQPWLVLITDGKPGDGEELPPVQAHTKELILQKKLCLWPLAVGNDEDREKYAEVLDVLNEFSPTPKALHLKNLRFKEFFEWLGKSVSTISSSKPGELVKLDVSSLEDWANL